MVTRYDLTEEVETGKDDITPVPENMGGGGVMFPGRTITTFRKRIDV